MKKILSLVFLLSLLSLVTKAQTIEVTGQINDEQGAPVSFATITQTGTNKATTANAEGRFTIKAVANTRFTISATGYLSQTVTISGSTLNVTLKKSDKQLEEVVVTALGIRRTDKALGYSIAKVDPNVITQKSEPDMLKSLQGKVAGVDIRSSQGTPGAGTRIQIRGNASFFGESQPLIIVDGIPFSNDQVTTTNQTNGGGAYSSGIENLDPNDIASMNVLKGSAAGALYGSRAANGVIIITTKSGSASKGKKGMEVTYKSSFSIENIANFPKYQNEYGAGSQGNYSAGSNGSWGEAFATRDSIPVWADYKAAYPELFPSDSVAYRAYPNNVKDLFNTGKVWENSIGLNGGDDKTSAALTASQLIHEGYVPNSSYKRQNLSLGASTKLEMGLNVRGNFSYTNSRQTGGFFGENQVEGAASQFARSLFLARNWDLNLPFETKTGDNLIPNSSGYDNPRWSAKYNRMITDEERYLAGMHLDYSITKWARVDYNIGVNTHSLERREITEIGSRAAFGLGRIILESYKKQEIESVFLLTLTPSIGKDLTLNAVLGHNINQRTTTDKVNTGNQFITKGIYTLQNTAQQAFNSDDYFKRRLIGVFAEATVGYKNYAFVTVTGRNDWSSTLPTNKRSYFYPAISGSLIFTDALDMHSNTLDYGKVRAGWAKVGNDADPYSLRDVFKLNPNFLGVPTATSNTVSNNPKLEPEFSKELELGTTLSFLKRRIELDFTWYRKISTNQIAPIPTPPSSGQLFKYLNFGEIKNTGIEIDLTVVPIQSKDFKWSVHGVFTQNKNTVVKLMEGVDRIQQQGVLEDISPYFEPGKPYGYLRGTISARDSLGNLLINPASGAIIDARDPDMIGDPNPKYKLGVTNTFTYKGFFLNVLFDMTKGGDIYSVTVNSLMGRGVTKDTRDRQTTWVIPGVYGDPDTYKPIISDGKEIPNVTRITTNDLYFSPNGGSTFAINGQNEWSVYDATVYRIREVSLGYNIPKSFLGKLPIGSASISVTGRNLWHLAPNFPKYTNFDPEVNSFGASSVQGIELSAAPTTRRYGINLVLTF